ncbi:hypothetical protein ABZ883_14890 [Streptomyces sp. NPDC046977]|uniref:hypothetical protein n=1 Tax=Streptomyces sp. NPDC046977 TaxID=3154703 RepID=UPI003405C3B3
MTPITRECGTCGTSYTRKASEAGKYCSRACYAKSKQRDVASNCQQCGTSFTHKPRESRKYCSPACAADTLRRTATRNCDHCGSEYSRVPAHIGKYCSSQCRYAAQRKPDQAGRRMVHAPGHPLVVTSPYLPASRVLLYEAIGPGTHPCHHCKEPVTWRPGDQTAPGVLVVDHLDRDPMNDALGNLAPSCQTCNVLNADRTVRDDETYKVIKKGTRLRGERRECRTCRAEFVAYPDPRPNRGLYCSRPCARRASR